MIRSAIVVAALAASAAVAAVSDDAPRVLLLDEALTPRVAQLVGFEGDDVVFLDDRGNTRRLPIAGLTAVVAVDGGIDADHGLGAAATPATGERSLDGQGTSEQGVILLTDGQRFPGDLTPTDAAGESLVWSTERFGEMTIPLDVIARMLRPGPEAATASIPDAAPVEDEVYLVNGDVLRGFLVGIGRDLEMEVGDQIVELPRNRIAGVSLANPREALKGMVVWLSDGAIARVEHIDAGADQEIVLTLPEGAQGAYDISAVRGVAFDAQRLTPLSSLEPTSQAPVGDRLFASPVRIVRHPDARRDIVDPLNAEDVAFPGPMEVTWDLPRGAERIAGTAALAYGAAPWGDCELVMIVDGEERFRVRLNPDAPVAPFNFPVSGRDLTIIVEPGEYGPINDRVILHRPLLLLERGGA